MILSNEKRCRKNWFVQKSLHIKKKHVDPRRFKDWRAFWLTLARASKGFTAAGQRRNFTVLSPFPSQADPWETSSWTLARFHQMRIVFIFAFQNVLPMAHQPLLSLIDVQPLPTKKETLGDSQQISMRKRDLHESVWFMNVDANVQRQGTRASNTDHWEWADLSRWPEGKFHQIRLSQEI